MTRSFQCGSPISASIPFFQNRLPLESLLYTNAYKNVTTSVVALLTDKRASFPVGVFNPPLLMNRVVSGSVRSTVKLHSVASPGALGPVPDQSEALPYSFGLDVFSPSSWFPATAARPVKTVKVFGLGCYEAWQNDTDYMEQGNYNSRGQYVAGCPGCGSNFDRSAGTCTAFGDLSCRAPSQGGGFNYRCVARRTDNLETVTYGAAIPFYGVWQGYCEQAAGYSPDLKEVECSSTPCRQEYVINYNGSHVLYKSGAFLSGTACTDIQNIRQVIEISGSFPITDAWLLTAASSDSEFLTLFARDSSILFPVFGLNNANGSAVLRVGHENIEVRSASQAIEATNSSIGSAFQSSIPGYFQVLRLKNQLSLSNLEPRPGSYTFISGQALVISAVSSGELLVYGSNSVWDLLNRQRSRGRCASATSTSTRVSLLNTTNILATVFAGDGAIVRRLVAVEPTKLFLDLPLPALARLPALIHVTLDDSAVPCSSAVGSHTIDIVLPPQVASDSASGISESLDMRAFILVQPLADVQSPAADPSGFCPDTAKPLRTVDGRVVSLPKVLSDRGLIMTECSRMEFGAGDCFLARSVNNSNPKCAATLDSPASEFYLGTSIGINNNVHVNSSDAKFLSNIASAQKPSEIDLVFKFRIPSFPYLPSNQARDPSSAPDSSDFFTFYAASVIRGGAVSNLNSMPFNVSRFPADLPLMFPRTTISLATYAQDDVLKMQSLSPESNSAWYQLCAQPSFPALHSSHCRAPGPKHWRESASCCHAFPPSSSSGTGLSKSLLLT